MRPNTMTGSDHLFLAAASRKMIARPPKASSYSRRLILAWLRFISSTVRKLDSAAPDLHREFDSASSQLDNHLMRHLDLDDRNA